MNKAERSVQIQQARINRANANEGLKTVLSAKMKETPGSKKYEELKLKELQLRAQIAELNKIIRPRKRRRSS